ncbi:MAG: UDP-N-acetylmuramate--L-alanine ligase [Planctomycetes bacterium]|jgi:UDP-N-acetylmuramate--alanine ligase|nr:UDP-N-acetylmuramate--L-alanine ligase [Planctomycetota bacterium]
MQYVMESGGIMDVPLKGLSEFAGKRVHLIGIGGSGMCALAGVLLDCGAIISGSDMAASPQSMRLESLGAKIGYPQSAANLPPAGALVVHSSAIKSNNPELLGAMQGQYEVLKYAQMLGRLMKSAYGVAISGTHGKSTTTGMVSWTLKQASKDPSYIVGAGIPQLGTPSAAGKGNLFVVEACEFDRSFLNYQPHLATILNIDEDHLDCYRDLDDIVNAFACFASNVSPDGVLVINGEDPDAIKASLSCKARVETFGLAAHCHWRGTNLSVSRGRRSMDVLRDGKFFARLSIQLAGLHNAYNALAAAALLHHAGVDADAIAQGVKTFNGVERRMMHKATTDGITVVDDYAHHPAEIEASLKALREFYQPKRLICVFQPHQHSRTRFLLKDFATSLSRCDEAILPDIYFVRDSEMEKDYISSEDLAAQVRMQGGDAVYLGSFDNIKAHLQSRLKTGDLLVTMGAGNVWEIADEIIRWLGKDC